MDLLNPLNAAYLEDLLRLYAEDPAALDPTWRDFFAGEGRELVNGLATPAPHFAPRSIFHPAPGSAPDRQPEAAMGVAQLRIGQLINAYRRLGHLRAELDPLGFAEPQHPRELTPAYWGFTDADLDRTYATGTLTVVPQLTLRELVDFLEETYCRTIGCEYMHISDEAAKSWLQRRCESTRNHAELDRETQVFILQQLCAAEAFEEFLQLKFLGAKRFSLEGAESLLPMLWLLLEEAAHHGVRDMILGMAHRGRLNTLVNLGCKPRKQIFREFADTDPTEKLGRGDVKYHLGCDTTLETRHGDRIRLALTFNPSHLEAIDPVVEGIVRARQDVYGPGGRQAVLPVLIHGDAAFIAQGLVAETLNLMNLRGYSTGGTVHIIVNNQIGFTTDPFDARSSNYCTDIAKMTETPIFHVNGEDPEAVVQAVRVAAEFRQRFARDIIIDMVCFRRYGHNEADEPRFTQPRMYTAVAQHPATHVVYARRLADRGMLTPADAEAMFKARVAELEAELADLGDEPRPAPTLGARPRQPCDKHVWDSDVEDVPTHLQQATFERILSGLATWPESFAAHRVLTRLATQRQAMATGQAPLDWGSGELLAYGALLLDGYHVRLSGQDAQRGTFGHRHAVLTDQNTGETYVPLRQLAAEQGNFEALNSPLSEAAVLGFEFGYALERPDTLVLWEAQFGDFANGAQVIIDQFISASEDKWEQRAGVVLLLPHGYEGQGPEHSSARLERFLQLCADDNMQVCNLSSPAQLFHALRRQKLRKFVKPLVIMTPKSLLRHKRAVSPAAEFLTGQFQRVVPETLLPEGSPVRRVVLCSGKVYYDLLDYREQVGGPVALLRVEQLYPFPEAQLLEAIAPWLATAQDVVWCQEEPQNMGAYTFLYPRLTALFDGKLPVRWVTRDASASPATGSASAHRIEQDAVVKQAFDV